MMTNVSRKVRHTKSVWVDSEITVFEAVNNLDNRFWLLVPREVRRILEVQL
jgi:hypothetical protein